jgi:hypothetical protein
MVGFSVIIGCFCMATLTKKSPNLSFKWLQRRVGAQVWGQGPAAAPWGRPLDAPLRPKPAAAARLAPSTPPIPPRPHRLTPPRPQIGTCVYFATTNVMYTHDGQHWQKRDFDRISEGPLLGGGGGG